MPKKARILRAVTYIHENLSQQMRLEDIARAANLSQFHLARVFKNSYGMPPRRYLFKARISKARDLLRSTGMPISQIAVDCGFSSQSHFTTAFVREVGIPPGTFRRLAISSAGALAWVSNWFWLAATV